MLLHRRFAHDELGRELLDRRRLGEQITREQRTAQHHEHVPLARCERRAVGRRLGLRLAELGGVAEQQAVAADPHLVAVPEPLMRPDAFAVEKRPVRRTEVVDAPTRREPFAHRVQTAHRRVVEHDVVLGALADRHPLAGELGTRSTVDRPHLELGVHGRQAYETAARVVSLRGGGVA